MHNKKIAFFGILGLGRVFANRLLNVFKKEVKKVKINGVFDKNKFKNIKYSRIFKVPLVKNIKAFLKLDFDFVYIATESGNHAKHIKYCLSAGKNVVVEKPPTLRVDQILEIQKLSQKKKIIFFCHFSKQA